MKYKLLVISAFCFFQLPFISYCQEKPRKGEEIENTILFTKTTLSATDTGKNYVLFFEDSSVSVCTSIKVMKKLIEKAKNYKEGLKFLQRTISDTSLYRICNAPKAAAELDYRGIQHDYVSILLESGDCWIINKADGMLIPRVLKQKFFYRCGFDCGDGGNRYYINNRLLFYIMTWII